MKKLESSIMPNQPEVKCVNEKCNCKLGKDNGYMLHTFPTAGEPLLPNAWVCQECLKKLYNRGN